PGAVPGRFGERGQAAVLPAAHGQHRRGGRAGVGGDRGLDLGRFDAVPADLGLVVLAAEELDVPAGAVPAPVAGAVEAFARAGPGHEPLGGAVLVAEVAHGHAGAADVELAGDPVGAVAHLLVQHVEGLVGEGAAVGDA